MLPRLLLAAFLLAHGAIHASFLSPRPPATAGGPQWPFELGRSWIFTPLGLQPEMTRVLGIALVAATIAAFALAALATAGVLPASVWGIASATGAVASIALLVLFFNPWLVAGVVIDLGLLGRSSRPAGRRRPTRSLELRIGFVEAGMNESARVGSDGRVADRLAWLAVVLAGASALAGLLVPGLYHDSDGWIRQARAADLVTLFAVVPVLGISLWRTRSRLNRCPAHGARRDWVPRIQLRDLRVLGGDQHDDACPHRGARRVGVVARSHLDRPLPHLCSSPTSAGGFLGEPPPCSYSPWRRCSG